MVTTVRNWENSIAAGGWGRVMQSMLSDLDKKGLRHKITCELYSDILRHNYGLDTYNYIPYCVAIAFA